MAKFDLSMYRHIAVHPVNGVIGAEIGNVDASANLSRQVVADLRRALAEFHVIFLRDQTLDAPAVAAFAAHFGELAPRMGRSDTGHPSVARMLRQADVPADVRNFGDRWHTDRAGDERPPKGFVLYCEEAPAYGGDTLFASLCQAYDALPPVMQNLCKSLTGIHSMSGIYDLDGNSPSRRNPAAEGMSNEAALDLIRKTAEHPLVCRHPDSGRPFLFATGAYLIGIKGLNEKESGPLIDQLNQHVVRPEFTCRFRWRRGSIAVLDNRCTQHYAVNDYAGFTRSMLRTELVGDWRPVSADAPPAEKLPKIA